jgi:hypothetical protein
MTGMGFTTGGENIFGDDGLSPFGGNGGAIMDTPLGGRNLLIGTGLEGQKISAIGKVDEHVRKDSSFWDGGDNIFELQSIALYGDGKTKKGKFARNFQDKEDKEDFI